MDMMSRMKSSYLFPEVSGCFDYLIFKRSRYSCGKLRSTLSSRLGRILFLKALDKSKTKLIQPYAFSLAMMMQGYLMPATGTYDKVKSTPSIMYDTSKHVIE